MGSEAPHKINPLARQLNEEIQRLLPTVLSMLSSLGRRLYFPKGILSQSAEADERAHRFNATIGIATEGGMPMHLPSIQRHLSGIAPDRAYPYSPSAGRPALRTRWREKLLDENPTLRGKQFGQPIVTSAITHGLSLVGDLFVDPGDVIVMPDKLWGNYRLLYELRRGAQIATFPFYDQGGFNLGGFAATLERCSRGREKLILLLNFPNNPTGYTPTPEEGAAISETLRRCAEGGTRLVVVIDDAYFGLFYHLRGASMTESLFASLTNLHPNLLAVKLDGATKEFFAWGLRCGFLTFGPGTDDAGAASGVCAALDAKARGAIRSSVSSSPHLSQSLVEEALGSSSILAERKEKREILRLRAEKALEVATAPRFSDSWEVYPFNSGYFMCVRVNGVGAERVRVHLLDRYEVGLIATSEEDLRVAFSCLELEEIEPLFELVHKAIQELR